MASRSIKVRQVFAELRHALGAAIPAVELLRLAAALVDASVPVEHGDAHCNIGLRPAFDQLPLDKAYADGGWRIMEAEPRCATASTWEDDPHSGGLKVSTVKSELGA